MNGLPNLKPKVEILNHIANELLMRKLINFLRENNEVKQFDPTKEEF